MLDEPLPWLLRRTVSTCADSECGCFATHGDVFEFRGLGLVRDGFIWCTMEFAVSVLFPFLLDPVSVDLRTWVAERWSLSLVGEVLAGREAQIGQELFDALPHWQTLQSQFILRFAEWFLRLVCTRVEEELWLYDSQKISSDCIVKIAKSVARRAGKKGKRERDLRALMLETETQGLLLSVPSFVDRETNVRYEERLTSRLRRKKGAGYGLWPPSSWAARFNMR